MTKQQYPIDALGDAKKPSASFNAKGFLY